MESEPKPKIEFKAICDIHGTLLKSNDMSRMMSVINNHVIQNEGKCDVRIDQLINGKNIGTNQII